GASLLIILWSPAYDSLASAVAVNRSDGPPGWASAVRVAATVAAFVVALVGYMYPVVRYLSRAVAAGQLPAQERRLYLGRMLLGACLARIPLLGTWGALQWAPKWSIALASLLPV